jgi:hypothetical protein
MNEMLTKNERVQTPWPIDTSRTRDNVVALTVDGQAPTPEEVQGVRDELAKAPSSVRKLWRQRNGRIDVVPGDNATIHPTFCHNGMRAAGWTRGLLIAVAGHERQRSSVLHEVAHAIDTIGEFSSTPRFLAIYEGEKDRPQTCNEHELESPRECFAGMFCAYYNGDNLGWTLRHRRVIMGDRVAEFFAEVETVCDAAAAAE